jgi:hypothetical protein
MCATSEPERLCSDSDAFLYVQIFQYPDFQILKKMARDLEMY